MREVYPTSTMKYQNEMFDRCSGDSGRSLHEHDCISWLALQQLMQRTNFHPDDMIQAAAFFNVHIGERKQAKNACFDKGRLVSQ